MKAEEVTSRLVKGVPKSAEWSVGEHYGPFSVDPKSEVKKVLYCVTPTAHVLTYFKKNGYDLLVSHHPFLTEVPQIILHTALDCCAGGLNDQWAKALNLQNQLPFDGTLGAVGDLPKELSLQELVEKCEEFIGAKVIGQVYSRIKTIKSVVICSGLGGLVTDLAASSQADCYILGEATDAAENMGFPAVIEIGHTLSEKCGVNLIRALLPEIQVDSAPIEIDRFGREVWKPRQVISPALMG